MLARACGSRDRTASRTNQNHRRAPQHWPGETALGAPDYLALARGVKDVYLAGVPALSLGQRDEARRLVLLVDALYDARVGLHMGASAR